MSPTAVFSANCPSGKRCAAFWAEGEGGVEDVCAALRAAAGRFLAIQSGILAAHDGLEVLGVRPAQNLAGAESREWVRLESGHIEQV